MALSKNSYSCHNLLYIALLVEIQLLLDFRQGDPGVGNADPLQPGFDDDWVKSIDHIGKLILDEDLLEELLVLMEN